MYSLAPTARVQQRRARVQQRRARRWFDSTEGVAGGTLGFVAGSLYQLVEEAEVVAAVAVGEGWRRHRSRCGRGGGRGLEEAGAVAAVAVGEGCYTAHASQRRGHCGWGPRAHGPAGSTPGPCAHRPSACGGGLRSRGPPYAQRHGAWPPAHGVVGGREGGADGSMQLRSGSQPPQPPTPPTTPPAPP